ncbi:MAG: metallophosphoesterase [Betaproteobacteria bacterium]|nr:metallophosphoesterase [Betaproteobacteria bacterium]
MRLHVLSDLHLERAPFTPGALDADMVVLAGDVHNGAAAIEWAKREFRVPVLFVAGNHEPFDGEFFAVSAAIHDAAAGTHVTVLDCGEIRREGVRFLGCTLWTDYSLAPEAERAAIVEIGRKLNPDYRLIRYGARPFAPEDSIALHRAQRDWLEQRLSEPFAGTTVVITHFAPHPGSIASAWAGHPANPGFVVDLEHLMGIPALWIHGHTHTFFDYTVSGTRILCNPRGNPDEKTGFRPDLVVEV